MVKSRLTDILLGVMHSYWWIYIATLWFWVQSRCKNFQLLVVRDMGWSPEHDKVRKVVFTSSLSYILMPRCVKVIIRLKITFLWTLLGCYVTNPFINQFVLGWGYHHFHATPKTSTRLRILHEWTLHAKRRKPPSKVYGREVFPSGFQHLLYHTDIEQSIVLRHQLRLVLWVRVNFDKASAVWAQNYNFSHLSLLCGLSVYLTIITQKPFARENQTTNTYTNIQTWWELLECQLLIWLPSSHCSAENLMQINSNLTFTCGITITT